MNRRAAALLIFLAGWSNTAWSAELASSALGNIFTKGETIVFAARADADMVRWSVKDFFGKEIATGNTSLTGGKAAISPGIEASGYFSLDANFMRGGTPAGSEQAALAILPPPSATADNSPFGAVTHFAKDWPLDIIPLIERAGIRRVRDEQPWRKVEKQAGRYQFPPRLTGYMSELKRRGIDPLIVLAFSNPLYDGDKTPHSPQGRAGYAAYAAAVAARYGNQLSAVEVWNEYNGSFCDGPCRADRPAYYAAMLKQSYASLKAANPSLTVLGGAGVPIPLDHFKELFGHGALDTMDAIVIHPYRKTPEGVEEKIEELRQTMQRHGKVKPVWVTEFSDLPDMRKSRDDVARYLVRMSTLLLAARVERIYWYLMKDYQEFFGLGLLRSETDTLGRYAPTPAYAAYAVLIRQLEGARFVRREPSDPMLRVYLFSRGEKQIRVAWSIASPANYTLPGGDAWQAIDMMGNARALKGGQILLDRNPVYLTGPP